MSRPARRIRPLTALGIGAWAVQPLYVAAELIAAAAATAPYSLLHHTISDLGAVSCTDVAYPYGAVAVCSPLHALANGAFIVFGVLIAVGAVLLRTHLGRGGWARTSVVAFVVAGLGSIGSGLTPLDQALELHVLVSTPTFLAQPVALLAAGIALRRRHRGLAVSGLLTGAVTLLASLTFFALSLSPDWGGLLERLALWPAYGWLLAFALAALRRRLVPA